MLEGTKEQIGLLVAKVNVLEFVLNSLNLNHADYKERIETQYKQASNHKLKLTDEILRLCNAVPIDAAIAVPSEVKDA